MIEVQYYWLGLYKIISPPGSANYWSATRWYDGSTSAFRWWADGYPLYLRETCIAYTKDGWKDQPCDYEYYFIVKKPAGCSVFLPRRFLVTEHENIQLDKMCRNLHNFKTQQKSELIQANHLIILITLSYCPVVDQKLFPHSLHDLDSRHPLLINRVL